MAIPKILHISFFEDESLKPRLVIRRGDLNYEVRRRRWLQFLSLLAYRRLTNINNGWVTLEDINPLSAFKDLEPKVIGKYISDSSSEFPPTMYQFIDRYLDITTTGPYNLYLNQSLIDTDILRLKEYIELITTYPPSSQRNSMILLDNAIKAYEEFDLSTSLKLTKAFINEARRVNNQSLNQLALAYIQLAEIERKSNRQRINPAYAIEKAKSLCQDIKQSRVRNPILSLAFATQALITKPNRRNIKKILELNQIAIDHLQLLPDSDPDKYCLLAGRHYHLSYIALRHRTMDKGRDEFNKALHNYREMLNLGPTKLVYCEPGIIEGIQFLHTLIRLVKNSELVGNDELTWYMELVEKGEMSSYLTLSIGEWINKSLVISGHLDEAVEFTGECLIAHARLYETGIYHRLVSEHRKLKAQLR